MRRGRILALDYGSRNIGLALSDELGLVVRPLPSIPNQGRRDALARIKCTVKEHEVESIVVGLPFNMDGSSGTAVERVQRFMEYLRRELEVPLRDVDERLSTVEATELWREMTARRQRRYRTVDSLAAALILERFLRES